MRIAIRVLALAATTLSFAVACDQGGTKEAETAKTGAIVDEEASADTEATEAVSVEETPAENVAPLGEDEGESEELPPDALSIEWTDGAEAVATTQLTFTVTNTRPNEITFSISVSAKSVLGKATLSLGESTLAAGASASFSVDAIDLPVRSDKVVGLLTAASTRTIETPDGAGRHVRTRSASRYYRHLPGYGQVRTYTRDALASELGGVTATSAVSSESIASVGIESAAAAETLGDVSDGAGGFTAVSTADSGLVARDGDGQAIGFVGSVRRGGGLADPGDAVETTEASAAVEVGDE